MTQRFVCELDPSKWDEESILDALAACEEHNAALSIVWVIAPEGFGSPIGARAGGAGGFGLPAVLGNALESAARRGIPATSAVRFGQHEVVLRDNGRRLASVAPSHRVMSGV